MKKKITFLLFISIIAAFHPLKAMAFPIFHYGHDKSLSLYGSEENEQFGSSIAVMDLNKDGFEDLAVGSPYYAEAEKTKRGKVEVYLGPIEANKTKPDFTILGANEGDLLGTSLAAGDINGDGWQDLIMGAPGAAKDKSKPGAVYLFMGKAHFFLEKYDFSVYQPDLTVYGPHNNSFFGLSLLAYDINDDNDVDIVSGAPLAKNDDDIASGNVYVVSWNNAFATNPFYNLAENTPTVFIPGEQSGSLFGSGLAQGNFDSDNKPDLAISAYAYSSPEKEEIGAVYLFLNFNNNSVYRKNPNNLFLGEEKQQWFGFNLNSLRLNDDRYDDLAISSFSFKDRLKLGKTWLIHGSSSIDSKLFGLENLLPTTSTLIDGANHNSMLGSTVASEDINRDGMIELIVASPNISNTTPSEVKIFGVNDFSTGTTISIFDKNPSHKISSLQNGDWFGQRLLVADFNRDGAKDLVITAPMTTHLDTPRAGAVSIFFMQEGPEISATESTAPISLAIKANEKLTRAEATALIVEKFDLEEQFSTFIESCYQNLDFCFFVFSSQSKYEGITFAPDILLYPDVPASHPYYQDIIKATMLGLVNGNLSEPQSPFKPDLMISRIQALKLMTEAAMLERNNFFQEIIDSMGGDQSLSQFQPIYQDVSSETPHMWWYFKYINLGYELGILEKNANFRPDEAITKKEFTDLLERMYNFAR